MHDEIVSHNSHIAVSVKYQFYQHHKIHILCVVSFALVHFWCIQLKNANGIYIKKICMNEIKSSSDVFPYPLRIIGITLEFKISMDLLL